MADFTSKLNMPPQVWGAGFLGARITASGMWVMWRPPVGVWYTTGSPVNRDSIKNLGDGTYIHNFNHYPAGHPGVSTRYRYAPERLTHPFYDVFGTGVNSIDDINNTHSDAAYWIRPHGTNLGTVTDSPTPTVASPPPPAPSPSPTPVPSPSPAVPGAPSPPVVVTEVIPTASTPPPGVVVQTTYPIINTSVVPTATEEAKFPWWVLVLIAATAALTS